MRKFSFSKGQCFLTCQKKYYWQYVRNLRPRQTPKAFIQGSAFHEGMAGQPGDTLYHRLGRLARLHWPLPAGNLCEQKIEVEIDPGIMLECIVDELSPTEVIEYKTMSRPDADSINAHVLSSQLRLYAIAFNRPKILLRIVRKAEVRIKKGETDEQFEERFLQEYIDKPNEYFLELPVEVGKPGTIREILQTIKLIDQTEVFVPNAPYACYGRYACSYMPLCVDEATNIMLYEEKEERDAE